MNQFEKAVGRLREVLRDQQAGGRPVRCSRGALERFRGALGRARGGAVTGGQPQPDAAVEGKPAGEAKPAGGEQESASPLPVQVPAGPVLSLEERRVRLAEIHARVAVCRTCEHLAASRTQPVFGVGDPVAELMFVGEAPGEDEDLRGEPFVGKAGQLLTRIIETMGFSRETVYIANVLKCRPDMPTGESGNRKPRAGEMATCLPYLREQIGVIRPRVLVALGATAMEGLVGETQPMARLRGKWHGFDGIPLMATYHPAYLLRNQSLGEKRKVWEDMLLVLERLGRPVSDKQRAYFLSR